MLDRERYEEYKAIAAETVRAAGGRYLVRGGDVEVLEGEPPRGGRSWSSSQTAPPRTSGTEVSATRRPAVYGRAPPWRGCT